MARRHPAYRVRVAAKARQPWRTRSLRSSPSGPVVGAKNACSAMSMPASRGSSGSYSEVLQIGGGRAPCANPPPMRTWPVDGGRDGRWEPVMKGPLRAEAE